MIWIIILKVFDIELTKVIAETVSIPVIASGGAGALKHFTELYKTTPVDGIAIASLLHYKILSISEIKMHMQNNGISSRL